jgi:hypothetical protein
LVDGHVVAVLREVLREVASVLVEAAAEGQEVGHVAEMLREVVLGFHEESALAGGVYWPRLARFPGPHFAPIAHLGWEFGMAPRLRAAAGGGLAGFVLVDGARPP